MMQTITPDHPDRCGRATQIDRNLAASKTYGRRAIAILLAGVFAIGTASTVSGQETEPGVLSPDRGVPKSLLPFADLFQKRTPTKATPAPKPTFPTGKATPPGKRPKIAQNGSIGRLDNDIRQVANEEAIPADSYERLSPRAERVAEIPSRKIPSKQEPTPAQQPVSAANDEDLPSKIEAQSPVVHRISDDEDPEILAEPPVSEEKQVAPEELPVDEPKPEVLPSTSEALSSLVQFKPHKVVANPASVPARPALVKRVEPTDLQPGSQPGEFDTGAANSELLQPPSDPAPKPEPEEITAEFKSIGSLGVRTKPEGGKFPNDVALSRFKNAGEVYQSLGYRREWATSAYAWEAPGLCHSPLYFQEINLERHGYSFGIIQPGISGLQFYGRLIMLPYLMAITPPTECVYTLGYYRPGSYAPFQLHKPPVRARGMVSEAAVIAALFILLP